jgi:thiol-disulfide isomerase/thioredoxin
MIMKKILTFILFALTSLTIFGQEFNKIIIDEETGKQMLVGECTLDAFQDTAFSWWNTEYETYEPNIIPFEDLDDELKDIFFVAFMGTWCSDSQQLIPRFFKLLDDIAYPQSKVKIISVDRKKKSNIEGEEGFGVSFVPTIIVYKANDEIGRIVEFPIKSLEEDIADIILDHSEE